MQPSNTKFNGTTYGFKHMFEPMFGYITNEEMKEILLELGIRIVNMQNLN